MHKLAERAKKELVERCVSPEGWFYASGAQNIGQGNFNCLFGRDACITVLLLLEYAKATGDDTFIPISQRSLEKLADTAGRRFNLQTGEKPGWIIHEQRTGHHHYLTVEQSTPWPTDEDGVMRIYESIDSTPLYLLAMYRYHELAGNELWLSSQMYAIKNALNAILRFGDNNRDGLVDYMVPVERTCGGLMVQNWMDSTEGWAEPLVYPIAPLEVQGYVWLAFRLWANYFHSRNQEKSLVQKLDEFTESLRQNVWDAFLAKDEAGSYLAANINGRGKLSEGAYSSMGHLLWAMDRDGDAEGVLGKYAETPNRYKLVARRIMGPDLFDPLAGIRTLSDLASHFNPKKYHNGAVWTHDNALIYLGLRNLGLQEYSRQVAEAVFVALQYFDAPGMELYYHTAEGYGEFHHSGGNPANRVQAWALAGVLAMAALEQGV